MERGDESLSIGLYFAGEHTCRLLYGTLQAAVASGARAAIQAYSERHRKWLEVLGLEGPTQFLDPKLWLGG